MNIIQSDKCYNWGGYKVIKNMKQDVNFFFWKKVGGGVCIRMWFYLIGDILLSFEGFLEFVQGYEINVFLDKLKSYILLSFF